MYKQKAKQDAGSFPGFASRAHITRANRWSLYLPALFFLTVALWVECLQTHCGTALAAAAFAAIVLLVRYRIAPRWEKLFWGGAVAFLLAAELGVVVKAHRDANSFLFGRLTPDGQLRITAKGGSEIRSGMLTLVDWDSFEALRSAHVIDPERFQRLVQFIPLGNLKPGTSRTFSIQPIVAKDGTPHYRLIFSAQNGLWWEDLEAHERDGRVFQKLRVMRYRHLRPARLFAYEQPGLKSVSPQADWVWAKVAP